MFTRAPWRYAPWLVSLGLLCAQSPPAGEQNSPEMTSHETPATFRTKVNLVLVPVVVRDSEGHTVGNLRKEDFQILDKGKAQTISQFAVEKAGTAVSEPPVVPEKTAPEALQQNPPAPMPERFEAYVFDDVHLEFGDLAQVREAAERQWSRSLEATDRIGIFTTSGRTTLDFTDDRAQLHNTLLRLRPRPIARSGVRECPDISYYQADLIQNRDDTQALQAAALDTVACQGLDPNQPGVVQMALNLARGAASRVLAAGDSETRISLGVIKDVVRRMAAAPGQRSVILVSPGFVTAFDLQPEKADIMDRAIRANVVISSLDARGLYTIVPGGDATQEEPQSTAAMPLKANYPLAAAQAAEDVLAELAAGTGGTYFHNSNDLAGGFQRVAARPEYLYVLGFSPQNLKLDGRFHALKVTVRDGRKLTLQARRGYYAPTHQADRQETARQEIQEAVFSREELHDIPVVLHTQFFKPSEDSAKLSILARVDIRHIPFRKAEGRNCDDLTVVSGLFDRNGNFVAGSEKSIQMRLKDETLEHKLGSGITVRSIFDVKPGSYVVRLVVRESEGEMMAATNGAVEIPY
jgi:VWFA-related protein